MKLFQITEDDLATLESELPHLCENIEVSIRNLKETQESIAMVKTIISNLRWNYQPHSQIGEE